MKNIKNKNLRKYLAGALIGASCLLSSCEKEPSSTELPVSADIQEEINQTYKSLEDVVNKVKDQFNESIKDGYFSLEEQQKVFENYTKIRKEYVLRNAELPEAHKNLYSLIDKNLHWHDYGVPELEKNLRKQNLSVAVGNNVTAVEGLEFILGVLVLAGVLANLGEILFGGRRYRGY